MGASYPLLMNKIIQHSGIIDSVDCKHVVVRITQLSACASCQIAGHCRSSESRDKLIDVYMLDTSTFHAGELVRVIIEASVGYRALALGMGLPLVLLVSVIVLVLVLGGTEGVAALSGLASLIPYYFILFLMREKIRRSVTFLVEKTSS